MNLFVPVALSVLLGSGLCGVAWSLAGVELFPNTKRRIFGAISNVHNLSLWVVGAVVLALLTLVATGWVVAAIWVFALVVSTPLLRSGGADPEEEIRRVTAIATWTEQIRDTIAASAGIQHALIVTAQRPPKAIAAELHTFSLTASRDLPGSLRRLGANLNNSSSDLVIAGLLAAIELDAGRVSDLLQRLAESIRAEAAMRQRVEVSRSRIRTSWKIVAGANAATVLVLLVLGRGITSAYASVAGQLWLVLVGLVVVVSLWLFRQLAAIPQPARFVARERIGA